MKPALLATWLALAVLSNAADKQLSSPEYRVTEIPMFPDPPPDFLFDQSITSLNDRGQMTAVIPMVRSSDRGDEYFLDHWEGRFWDGRNWNRIADGSNDTFVINVNARGEVLCFSYANTRSPAFQSIFVPFTWRRGALCPVELGFSNAAVNYWNQRGDLAGEYYTWEPFYTNADGLVYTSSVAHPFLFRDGAYVNVGSLATGPYQHVIINRRGNALISSSETIPAGTPADTDLALLTRDGMSNLPVPSGWNIWLTGMGDDSFMGEFNRLADSNTVVYGAFVYRNGQFIDLSRTSTRSHYST